VERNISEFLEYQSKLKENMVKVSKMDHRQKVQGAKEALHQLIDLVDKEPVEESSNVLEFILVSLTARLKKLPLEADFENEFTGLKVAS